MKPIILMWMMLLFLCTSSYGETPAFTNDIIVQAIQNTLSSDWRVVEKSSNEIPHGHYWGLEYSGPKGQKLLLQGPRDITFRWRDHQNQYHDARIAKEALEVWIMPPDYGESWKRHFVIGKPIPARLIASGEVAKVYGFQTHRIIQDEEFESLLKQASQTSWPDSPHDEYAPLSWKDWQKDLREVLKNAVKKH